RFDQTVASIGHALFILAITTELDNPVLERKDGRTRFRANALDRLRHPGWTPQYLKTDPFGAPLTLERLHELDSDFTPDNLARAVTNYQMQYLTDWIYQQANKEKAKLFKGGKWTFPDGW